MNVNPIPSQGVRRRPSRTLRKTSSIPRMKSWTLIRYTSSAVYCHAIISHNESHPGLQSLCQAENDWTQSLSLPLLLVPGSGRREASRGLVVRVLTTLAEARAGLDVFNAAHLQGVFVLLLVPALATVEGRLPGVDVAHSPLSVGGAVRSHGRERCGQVLGEAGCGRRGVDPGRGLGVLLGIVLGGHGPCFYRDLVFVLCRGDVNR